MIEVRRRLDAERGHVGAERRHLHRHGRRHAELLQRVEHFLRVALRVRVRETVERFLDDPHPQLADVDLRVPVEGNVGDAHVSPVWPGDRLHDDGAVFGVAADRAETILRPRQRHHAVAADAPEGRTQSRESAAR